MKSKHALYLIPCLLAAGCASSDKALDQKLAVEPTVENRQQLQSAVDKEIQQDSQLSPDQKQKLAALRQDISAKTDEINSQSYKLRSVLVEELLSSNYSVDDVELIKNRLKKLEDKRLSVMFNGVDQANEILGHQMRRHPQMMRDILEDRSLHDRDHQ